MVKVKMLAASRGASEGHTVRDYAKGEVYEVSPDLALCFLKDGVAEEIQEVRESLTEVAAKSKKAKAKLPGME